MPMLSPSTSGSSAASSPKPAHTERLHKPGSKKLPRSSSWSAWFSGSVFRTPEAKDRPTIPGVDGQNDDPQAGTKPEDDIDIGKKGNLRKPGQSDEYKKCVTIEEPPEEAAIDAESDVHSDAGTVRRPTIPGNNTAPKFLLSPTPDGHRPPSPKAIDHLSQEHRLGGNAPDVPHHQPHEDYTRHLVGPRRTSQTVSRDDCLLARGANPRTGVVSPTVTDESHSDDLGPQVENPGGAMNNQKWRLKGDQWISLDASERTPLPTPSTDDGMHNSLFISSREQAQAHVTLLSGAGVPFKSLEDRFVVNMPSAREPCPKTMTPQQIADFQQACHQVYRYNNDMVDPERAPSPRAMTPGGPSTPPRKLFKIRDTLLQSAGPIERGRRGDRPPGQPHNPNTQGGPRQWRHSSAPPGGQPQHGWREQTNRSFLEDSRVYGREGGIQQMPNRRPVDPHQQMRWRPVPPDPYRPPGQYDRRSPRCSQYQSRRSPSMPRYPQEPHPHYRSTGPIERRNIDSNQGRRLSREIRLEPQSQASQTLQLGALKGDDLLATITTTTTTSTVTPIRLNSGEMEGYFTPDEATSKKSSSGQYHRASGESVATTTTRTGSVVSVDNAEKLRDGSQLTAVNITKFGGNTQGADGSIPTLGTQDGGTKDTNSSTPNWLSVQIASFTRRAFRNLLPMAIFCLTLAALTCRGYYQYMASRVPPELKTAQGVRSLKVIGGVLIVAIAISVILKFSAKDFYFGGSRDKIHTN